MLIFKDYEEITIPPARATPPRATERLIPVSELDALAKGSFPVCFRRLWHLLNRVHASELGIYFSEQDSIYHLPDSIPVKRKYAGLWYVHYLFNTSGILMLVLAPTGAVRTTMASSP